MICPNCKNSLTPINDVHIEIDKCNECEALWFDAGELEIFAKDQSYDAPSLTESLQPVESETDYEEQYPHCVGIDLVLAKLVTTR